MATIEKLEKSKVKLTMEIPADVFADAMQKAYLKEGKRYNVPGFRKGKAPRKVLENMYGEGIFYEAAFDLCYADVYEAAVKEHGVEPVDRPDVEILEVGTGKNLVFTATVAVKPEVKLGDYKGIEVEVEEYTITDEAVENEINRERDKLARYVDVDRAAELGDRAILDYSGSVDGVKFDGGTAEEQSLDLGSGMFIPGFEEQVVGMKAGEEKDITVTFPEAYHSEELAGKEAVFAIKLHSVQVRELPELDDEFAKDVSEFDTLDELRAGKRAELEAQNEKNMAALRENEAIRIASANAEVEIPDAMIDRQVAYMLQDISYRLQAQGLSFEQYLQYTGQTMESMHAMYRGEAEARVKTQLVLEAIAKAEGIEATEESIKAALAKYAEQAGIPLEELEPHVNEEERNYFAEQSVMERTVALLVESAVFVAKKEEEKKDEE